jgi:deoxyribonuclease-1
MKRKTTRPGILTVVVALALLAFASWAGLDVSREIEQLTGIDIRSLSTEDYARRPREIAVGDLPETPGSFGAAKRLLYDEVFADNRTEFYCGCPFDAEGRPDLDACGYAVRGSDGRAGRIEAEHVVPAYWIGHTRTCWREPICTDRNGHRFKGRDCCEEIDPVFRAAHNDLNNLWPSVGEVNADRSNFRFGMLEGEPREYGACDFEVDRGTRRAEPRPEIRGDIARISFYMERTYGVEISAQQRKLFEVWNKEDPPDAWEVERNERIKAIQGRGNPFVEDYSAAVARR